MFNSKDKFYLHIPSNASKNSLANKFNVNYNTTLLNSVKKNWKVSLSTFSFINNTKIFREDQEIRYKDKNQLLYNIINIEAKFYTVKSLISTINKKAKNIFNVRIDPNNKIEFYKQGEKSLEIDIDPYLSSVLGCKDNFTIGHELNHIGTYQIDPYFHIRYMFIYCNICDFSYTGRSLTQLLRIVSIDYQNYEYGDLFTQEFINEHFYNITCTDLTEIEIELRDAYGNLFPLEEGRSFITLHCKNFDNHF